ncbi:hypothetical protein LGQ02_03250 [Bacillus shivajii]|uniref:hypothetical protein n=1 Tax=Bacillus shivajii TaxID=1983719 RepID=UPI001CF97C36|nr:hypothetical protein [Bacillus shivajii]UCZ53817.1 hypothetical protein LGQ02_03250 [Bacillus shivajii]
MSSFFHKLFISMVSVVMFSTLIAGFHVSFLGQEQLSFGMLVGIYTFYTAPVFILGGIPASYIIDHLLKKHKDKIVTEVQSYVKTFGLYGLAGVIVAMIYFGVTSMASGQFFFTIQESITSIMIGIAASAVYYHMQLLLQITWNNIKNNQSSREQEA